MSGLAHVPAAPLRPLVAHAYGYRAGPMPTGVHRGLPSGSLTLVVELARPMHVTGLASDVTAHAVVGGLHVAPAFIDATGEQEGVQYALTPPAAHALLGVPAVELSGLTVDLADIIGPAADVLVERLAAAATWSERFAALDAALLHRLGDSLPRVPPEVAEAWRVLFATGGMVAVPDVARHVGWGRRHLTERFRQSTGLTPKQAGRVARFQAARSLLLLPARPALAEVAVRCGYADQAHLAREWRAMAGCSVTTWVREELPFVQDAGAPGGRDSAP
ncbi:AraC family transcriptional regulator [Georgenia faecalis]|uniref:Helix-turn-helix domain-containing protein n=1 Tax=Georgenia faecalis TaxID=2483799 RepID=A0ABV9DFK5_9MICO|nr:helix-turn-helix domain-containing protein [Georgenia faecalis]